MKRIMRLGDRVVPAVAAISASLMLIACAAAPLAAPSAVPPTAPTSSTAITPAAPPAPAITATPITSAPVRPPAPTAHPGDPTLATVTALHLGAPVAYGPSDCPATPAYTLTPGQALPDAFPAPTWYVNPERTIWAGLAPPYLGKWYAGLGQKVRWWARAPLQVVGRRLDGPAPPLSAQGEGKPLDQPLPTPHPLMSPALGGHASGITIPTPGCWEITARTPWDSFRFVVYAYPADYAPAPFFDQSASGAASGNTLEQRIAGADAVILGEIVGSAPGDSAFVRQDLRVVQSWKGSAQPGDHLTILRDQLPPGVPMPALTAGRQYILLLERRPAGFWRLTNDYEYGVVEGGQVRAARIVPNARFWQWQGESLAEADALLRRATGQENGVA